MTTNPYLSRLASFALGALLVGAIWYTDGKGSQHIETAIGPSNYIFSVASSTGDVFLTVANDGKVGVNVLKPETNLDVQGLLRARIAFPPLCTESIEGAIVYNRLTKHFIGCMAHGTGYDWHVLEN